MNPRDESGLILLASVEEARSMDRSTIEGFGIPGQVLMELAGAGTGQLIQRLHGPRVGRATVLAGGGNNGGDGYVIARHLKNAGWDVVVLTSSGADSLGGDCLLNYERYRALKGDVRDQSANVTARAKNRIGHADVVVDALFGIGLSRPITGPAAELIALANAATHGIKVAVDIPSGVDADLGTAVGAAFAADHTATYGLEKPGLHLSPGRRLAGTVHRLSIGVPSFVVAEVAPSFRRADDLAAAALLPKRKADGHKGTYGHVGIVGGFTGKEGAGILAALGALHGAAGLVTWIGQDSLSSVERPPEIMATTFESSGIEPRATSLVVGPGLGTSDASLQALHAALASKKPCVLDADALNLIARGSPLSASDWVMTPHPAEAARLLGCSTDEILGDRLGSVRRLSERYRSVVMLKGAEVVVAAQDHPVVIVAEGDATLSSGGTGDVLAGLVSAYLAQGLGCRDAAILGAFVHGRAGAIAGLNRAQRGIPARVIAETIPTVVGGLQQAWT